MLDLQTGQYTVLIHESEVGLAISWDGARVAWSGIAIWEKANVRDLTRGSHPAWSPDGAWIAYYNDGRIYKIPVSGGNAVPLADGIAWGNPPAWSSTGRIAFTRDNDVWVMNDDGSGPTKLTDHPAVDRSPAWSPDGRQIVFVSERDGNAELYVMQADGSHVMRLTNTPQREGEPHWIP
jgi:TolB protein